MLRDNLVPDQLTTHLQRKHNFARPGNHNAFTENVKYIYRMPESLVISIISESAQELNAVKRRIKGLEAQLLIQNPSYVSRHGLPDINHLHETRSLILDSMLSDRNTLPLVVQELRQLRRARGMRSQIRHDEASWWEVADDLEAALNPSGGLAQAVAALPPPADEPLTSGISAEGPNVNDPNWKPRYAPPFQSSWVEASYGEENRDGIFVPSDKTIHRTKLELSSHLCLVLYLRPTLRWMMRWKRKNKKRFNVSWQISNRGWSMIIRTWTGRVGNMKTKMMTPKMLKTTRRTTLPHHLEDPYHNNRRDLSPQTPGLATINDARLLS